MYQGAVFFDYDGTLVDETYNISSPTERTLYAIEQLKKNHYLVSLCTGRARSYVPMPVQTCFDSYITSNGALTEINNQIIKNDCIDSSALTRLASFLIEHKMNFIFESKDFVYCYDAKEELLNKMIARFNLPTHSFRSIENTEYVDINKVIITYNNEEKKNLFQQTFQDEFDVIAQHENPFSSDVTKKGISKAYGIETVIRHLNIDIKNTYAFGDGDNDLEMFQLVGTAIAMKNHAPSLYPHLSYITGSTKEEGIYHGLKKYQLI